jgi:hypothetical protein
MKQAIVHPDLTVQIMSSPIPVPKPNQVLIEVILAGSNPKDWKQPVFLKTPVNSGDDIAGIVHAVGEDVLEFKPGDRVAAFHEMSTPGGAFAEYALAPSWTTFHIPKGVSFEEVRSSPRVQNGLPVTHEENIGSNNPPSCINCGMGLICPTLTPSALASGHTPYSINRIWCRRCRRFLRHQTCQTIKHPSHHRYCRQRHCSRRNSH